MDFFSYGDIKNMFQGKLTFHKVIFPRETISEASATAFP